MTPEERAWEVIRRAFDERTPQPYRRPRPKLVVALLTAVLAAVVIAVLSPPGHAVFERVRKAVGIEHAAPALFSLPGAGRLLVVSSERGGIWLVDADGLKRNLGDYSDAAWSPHGLYIVATRGNQLVALDTHGNVRWTLPRIDPRWPVWEGTVTDTRIAYDAASGLRVVAGDGTGDHLLDRFGGGVPPAWDPALVHTLAYYSGGAIVLRQAGGKLVWRRSISVLPTSLVWSSDGRYLAVFSAKRVVVLDAAGGLHRTISKLGTTVLNGAFEPRTHRLAVNLRLAKRGEVYVVDLDHPGHAPLVFAGPGTFGDVAWGPAGGWLLVTWPTADQWVFLQGSRVHAVGNIRRQFPRPDGLGPELDVADGWCCSR